MPQTGHHTCLMIDRNCVAAHVPPVTCNQGTRGPQRRRFARIDGARSLYSSAAPPPPPPGLKFHQIGLKRRPLQPIAELLRECLQRFCLRGASFHRVVVPRRFDHEQVLYTSVFFARSDSGPLRVYRQSSRQALDMAGASSEVGLHRFEARFLRCMRRGHLEILGASALAGPRRGFALFVGACARLGGGVSGWGGRRRSRPGALAGLRGGAWPMRGSTGMTENG